MATEDTSELHSTGEDATELLDHAEFLRRLRKLPPRAPPSVAELARSAYTQLCHFMPAPLLTELQSLLMLVRRNAETQHADPEKSDFPITTAYIAGLAYGAAKHCRAALPRLVSDSQAAATARTHTPTAALLEADGAAESHVNSYVELAALVMVQARAWLQEDSRSGDAAAEVLCAGVAAYLLPSDATPSGGCTSAGAGCQIDTVPKIEVGTGAEAGAEAGAGAAGALEEGNEGGESEAYEAYESDMPLRSTPVASSAPRPSAPVAWQRLGALICDAAAVVDVRGDARPQHDLETVVHVTFDVRSKGSGCVSLSMNMLLDIVGLASAAGCRLAQPQACACAAAVVRLLAARMRTAPPAEAASFVTTLAAVAGACTGRAGPLSAGTAAIENIEDELFESVFAAIESVGERPRQPSFVITNCAAAARRLMPWVAVALFRHARRPPAQRDHAALACLAYMAGLAAPRRAPNTKVQTAEKRPVQADGHLDLPMEALAEAQAQTDDAAVILATVLQDMLCFPFVCLPLYRLCLASSTFQRVRRAAGAPFEAFIMGDVAASALPGLVLPWRLLWASSPSASSSSASACEDNGVDDGDDDLAACTVAKTCALLKAEGWASVHTVALLELLALWPMAGRTVPEPVLTCLLALPPPVFANAHVLAPVGAGEDSNSTGLAATDARDSDEREKRRALATTARRLANAMTGHDKGD